MYRFLQYRAVPSAMGWQRLGKPRPVRRRVESAAVAQELTLIGDESKERSVFWSAEVKHAAEGDG